MKSELAIASGTAEESGLPLDSEVAAISTIKRYPVLSHAQISTIFAYRNSGRNLNHLIADGFLAAEANQQRQGLLQNAFQDSASIDDLVVLCNLGLIVKVAKKYRGRKMEFQDMMQEGVFGLYRCLDDYDPTVGRFSTYATRGIENALIGAIRSEYSPVLRHPADLQDALRIGRKIWSKVAGELQAEPVSKDLYAELVTLVPRRSHAQEAAEIIVSRTDIIASLDKPVHGRRMLSGYETSLGERLQDESSHSDGWVEAMHDRHVKNTVNQALTSGLLSQDEARLIRLRFGFGGKRPMGLKEIGREVGLSRPTVARRIAGVLEKLNTSGVFGNLIAE